MNNKVMAIGIILVFLVIGFSGCIDDYIKGTGTVQYIDLEGGFYGIVGDNNEKYDPINLSEEFEIDGLQVEYTLKILDDQSSIHMWGTVVEVIKIVKL